MCVSTRATITRAKTKNISNFSFLVMALPRLPFTKKCLGRSRDLPRRTELLGFVRQRGRRRLGRVVADQAHLGEQVRHLHARERLEQRRHLRRNLRYVAAELV